MSFIHHSENNKNFSNQKNRFYGSILSASLLHLYRDMKVIQDLGIDGFHIDVMDGHYVPPISFGPDFVSQIRKNFPDIPLSVHLMIDHPDAKVLDYIHAGATSLSFHPRCSYHPLRLLELIRSTGITSSIAINPDEPPEGFIPMLEYTDEILVMGVVPGYSGQKFFPQTLQKIKMLKSFSSCPKIMIDGGVHKDNIKQLIASGVDDFVVGSYLFSHPEKHLHLLRSESESDQ